MYFLEVPHNIVKPLSIPYEVHRGRCLLCYPLLQDSIQRIEATGPLLHSLQRDLTSYRTDYNHRLTGMTSISWRATGAS
jgi:hypothetical protein